MLSKKIHPIRRFIFLFLLVLGSLKAIAQPCGCQNCPKDIPDKDTIQMPIVVNGAVKNNLATVGQGVCKVCIKFTHDFVSDLQIQLQSPAGQMITLIAPISQTGFTFNAGWNVCFLPCNQTPVPDPGFPPQWTNGNWGLLGNYNGSYYPYSGCLENFNTGTVNGVWKLIVQDGDDGYTGIIKDWSITFCDPTGLDCFTCAANGGDYSKINPIVACKGDNSLIINPIPIYTTNSPAPPATYYSYTNVISKNGIVVGFQNPVNMKNFQAGVYDVCGFSYLTADAPKLPPANGTLTFVQLKNLTLGTKPTICGKFSKGCIPVTIKAAPAPIFIDTVACNTYKYSTIKYTLSGFYTEKLVAKNGCDSFIYITLKIIQPVKKDSFATICQGQFFKVGLKKYNKTGLYKDTLVSKKTGCDSILTLFLTVKSALTNNLNRSICQGESVQIGTKIHKNTGIYKDTLQNAVGCDSIVTLDLKVKAKTSAVFNPIICNSGTYTFNNKIYKISGIYKDTLWGKNKFQCDSLVTINLTILPTYKDTFEVAICQGDKYVVGKNTYTSTGFYFDILKNKIQTCDSLVWTKLTVSTSIIKNIKVDICDSKSYAFDGKILKLSGFYTAKNKSKNGCDSVTNLNLIVHPNPAYQKIFKTICEGDTLFVGKNYKFFQTGSYSAMLSTKYGCDSLLDIALVVQKLGFKSIKKTICEGICEKIGDSTYCKSGFYTTIIKKKNLCDSTVILDLKVIKKSLIELKKTICEGDTVTIDKDKKYFETGISNDTLKNKNGCDSVVILDLLVKKAIQKNISETLCFGKNILINGKTYNKTGIFKDKLTSKITGCDSILTISIKVLPDYKTIVTKTICKGSSYLGQQNPGLYDVLLKTKTSNCDSLIQLNLSIADSIVENKKIIVSTANYVLGDSTYKKTGIYKYKTLSKAGCDSIIYLDLQLISKNFNYKISVKNIGCTIGNDKGTMDLLISPNYLGTVQVKISQSGVILEDKKLNSNEKISLNNLTIGTYLATLTNLLGEIKYDTFFIKKLPTLQGKFSKVSDFQGFGVKCPNDQNGFIYTNVTGGQAPYKYNWNNNFRDSFLTGLKAGPYSVTISDTLGCFVVLNTVLTSPVRPLIYFSFKNQTCYGANDGEIKIDSLKNGRPPFTYSIDLQPFNSNNHFKNVAPNVHLISIKDAYSCEIDTFKTLTEPPKIKVDLGRDTTIFLGESVTIEASTNLSPLEIDKIRWNDFVTPTCPTCLKTIVTPSISIGYLLELTDKNGCKGLDVKVVFVKDSIPVFIPTSFSPNDDGINDRFTVFSNDNIKIIKTLQVFNRWGDMVFEAKDIPTNDPLLGWDGSFRNLLQLPAVYVYKVEIELPDSRIRTLKGEITLLR